MSFINASQLATSSLQPTFDSEPQPGGSTTAPARFASDGFRSNAIALPNPFGQAVAEGADSFGGAPTASSPASLFASIMQSFANTLAQLVSLLSGVNAAPGAGNGSSGAGSAQTAFATASAGSTGDPHLAFNGTTSAGATASDKWDSMQGHDDLLDSDSFRGGYRVSTTTTSPNASGATYNASATVAMHGGRDAVTVNRDGSYRVTRDGQDVALTAGQAVALGQNESVTLQPDSSLTIVATNELGSRLTTTLAKNGSGVDVNASGSNVDLGGDLVNRGTGVAAHPPERSRETYGIGTEPLGAGEIEFA